mgnify:CR=1 FL=1
MSEDKIIFASPHIQEALPDLVELAKKAREACKDRKLGFVIVVHDPEAVDSYIASNLPQIVALALLEFTASTHGHGPPKNVV